MGRDVLRKGDVVEVRSAGEILATLDERGEFESVPFMPEMIPRCGKRFTVTARAERVCDTITWAGIRTIADTVLLDDLRCDGSGHDGCAAECLIYWKEAWLRPVSPSDPVAAQPVDEGSAATLRERVSRNTKAGDDASEPRYRCQATQALDASVHLSGKDPRSYLREYTTGNVSLVDFTRVMGRAVVMQSAKKIGLLAEPPVACSGPSSVRTPTIGLQPGDWVRVKKREDIEATLNDKGKNRGLWFDREMLPFCGQVLQVRQRITRLIDDSTGKMIELTSDCVTLDGAVCSGQNSLGRWFCSRAIYPYWREGWLERVNSPSAMIDGSEPS
jgi:hypothetical protein